MYCRKLSRDTSALIRGECGGTALVRAEDVPGEPGAESSVRVGEATVRFGPRPRDLRERRRGSLIRSVWFDCPPGVVVELVKSPRPVPAASGTIREFRTRRSVGA